MKNNKKKIMSLVLSIVLMIGLISPIYVRAVEDTKPDIEVEYLGTEPQNPIVGQDFKVKYKISPQPFEYVEDTSEKQIVLVLDKSGSMDDNNKMVNLKAAAKNFIDSLTKTEENTTTPKIKNLKIAVVSYDKYGYITSDLTQVTDINSVKSNNVSSLEKKINSLKANGGTNTGEGLRKAAYLLKNDIDGKNKTIIFMSDGMPTYYSYEYKNDQQYYYRTLDNKSPSVGGNGGSDPDGYCIKYAEIIGEIIKSQINCNIFSIGYGLDDENSDDNKNMKAMHESMGGIDNNFFASGAGKEEINDVFQSIAGKILKTTFNDVNLELDIGENFTIESGLEISDGNSGKVAVGPIEYSKDPQNANRYIAESQTVEFTVKAKQEGNFTLIKSGKLTYSDIDGNPKEQSVSLQNVNIGKINGDMVKILEVEPADSFKLSFSNNNTYIKTGIEQGIVNVNNNGYGVEIEHISMPEFVGKIDKLNGKYDIIVLGRWVDNDNITSSNNVDQLPYRDYNLDQKIGDGLVENDITDRKSKEILNFIESGQLLYIDKSIINPQNNNFKNLKIYKNFNSQSEQDNCKTSYSVENLKMDTILNDYLNNSVKKRYMYNLTSPQGDSMSDEKGDINKRNMKFVINTIKSNLNENEKVDVNLYLDTSGDGLFQDDEIVKTLKDITPNNNIELSYKISSGFVGYLDWKLEIVKKDGSVSEDYCVKSYYTGNIIFRSLTGDKVKIDVLQIAPFNENDLQDKISGNLNLSTSDSGNDRFKNLLKQLKDYDITIDTKSIDEINSMADNNTLVLNGKYQMIILGFGDAFNSRDMNSSAIEKIKQFINTKQGIMFTHDTISPWFANNVSNGFIDLMGYVKLNNVENWQTNRNSYKRNIFDGSSGERSVTNAQSKIVYNTNASVVTNYPFNLIEEDNYINVRRTHSQYYQLDLENENVVPCFTEIPNTVGGSGTKLDYEDKVPEDIKSELSKNGRTVDDMKRDDTNYTSSSSSNKINQYDVKNNYYTYSIGNITFSGTGENSKEYNTPYPTEELELFVNTITKAIRGANHAPVINENCPEEIFKDEDLKFTATFSDMDNDKVKANVYIVEDNNDKPILNYDYMESGTSKDISIDKSKYENKELIKVKIVAEDEHGAKSEIIKEIKINPSEAPIKVEVSGAKGLVGDTISAGLNLTKNPNIEVTNVSVELDDSTIEKQLFEYSGEMQSNVNFSESNIINKQYELKANGQTPDGCGIKATIKYDFEGTTHYITRNIPVSIRDGSIKVIVNREGVPESVNPNVTIQSGNVTKQISMNKMNTITVNESTGEYIISLENTGDYQIVNKNPVDGKVNIDYDNPTGEFICTLSNINIEHGVYSTDELGNIKIDEGNNRFFPKESVIPMAASFNISYEATINLTINNNLELVGEPIAYKIVSGNLEKIGSISEIENKISSDNTGDIIIIYTVKLYNQNQISNPCKNSFSVNGGPPKDAYIEFKENILPDLF